MPQGFQRGFRNVLADGRRTRTLGREGVREYWAVEPADGTIDVYRRTGEALVPSAGLSKDAGDALTSPLLPGFEVPLARLFRAPRD